MMPPVKEPLAGLALLVIFGFLIWYNRPIESVRPFDPYFQHQAPRTIGNDAYEAWLWKDPFGFDLAATSGGAAEAWARVDKGEKPNQESKASAGSRKGEGGKSDREPHGLTCQVALEKMVAGNSGEGRSVQILAPLVKVTPDTVENKEMRTRQRYAVVAGLIESGYQPLEPESLHFCSIQEDSREYDMRWERYRHELESKADIIVAWIDSEVFTAGRKFLDTDESTAGRNLARRNRALDKLVSSEILLSSKDISKNFHILDLNNALGQNRFQTIKKQIGTNVELIKPAGKGDEELAKKLTLELKLRGIKEPSHLIMITEQGLENTATLASNIRESLGKSFVETRNVFYLKGSDGNPKKIGMQDKNENQAADKAEPAPVIDLHQPPPLPIGPGQIDYFHRLAGEIRNVHDTVDLDKRDSGVKAIVILGSDFNDKLLIIEALREKMPNMLILTTDLDAQMLYPKHWRSTRNLVVASHFDQQLDNETYQKKFPSFRDSQQTNIFYSVITDVTGHAQKPETTSLILEVGRNGFVRLDDAEKNNSPGYHPPDNARENTAKRLGLLFWITVSLIVFRYAIVPISGRLTIYLAAGTVAIFAIAFAYIFATDGSGEPLSFTDGVSLWPTLFIQGIAILWAIALFFRAIQELDDNFCSLSRRYFPNCLPNFPVCPDKNETDKCEPGASKWRYVSYVRQQSSRQITQRSLKGWPFVVLALTIFVYVWNDVYPAIKFLSFWPCMLILCAAAFVYIYLFKTEDYVSIKYWIEKDDRYVGKTNQDRNSGWGCGALRKLLIVLRLIKRSAGSSGQGNYEDGLWRDYYHYGVLGHRIIRVVAIWLAFAIIETLLVYLLPPRPLPWRGATDLASRIDLALWTGVMSFTVTMLLLFFIIDAVRLNFYWIHKLRTRHPLLKGRITQEDIDAYDQMGRNCPAESLENIVSLVAERTRGVDKLIYYPMLCIMLMLFSKITYFDNQELPLSKGITYGLAISFLFFLGFMLQHEANQLKLSIKKSLKNLVKNKKCTERTVDNTVNKIDAIDEGAFQPMFEQPVMQALLIILASVGLFAGEYLKLLG
jgi:hypothetical protein